MMSWIQCSTDLGVRITRVIPVHCKKSTAFYIDWDAGVESSKEQVNTRDASQVDDARFVHHELSVGWSRPL